MRYSHILCLADNIKLYLRVGSLDDCFYLQINLDKFVNRFGNIGLSLNISKCKVLTYTRSRLPITHALAYNVLGSDILRANKFVIDLVDSNDRINNYDLKPIVKSCCNFIDICRKVHFTITIFTISNN